MGFAEAEQTDSAVSIASDISWTYSLDFADSLKPAGSSSSSSFFSPPSVRFLRMCLEREKKVMAPRRNRGGVTVKMKLG